MNASDGQYVNAPPPIHRSFESASNVIVERDRQLVKHSRPSRSTEEGIQIDKSDEQLENVESPIHESLEPDSKTTVESPW
jgi:hypothetical protein